MDTLRIFENAAHIVVVVNVCLCSAVFHHLWLAFVIISFVEMESIHSGYFFFLFLLDEHNFSLNSRLWICQYKILILFSHSFLSFRLQSNAFRQAIWRRHQCEMALSSCWESNFSILTIVKRFHISILHCFPFEHIGCSFSLQLQNRTPQTIERKKYFPFNNRHQKYSHMHSLQSLDHFLSHPFFQRIESTIKSPTGQVSVDDIHNKTTTQTHTHIHTKQT